jgi:hypothetical protein
MPNTSKMTIVLYARPVNNAHLGQISQRNLLYALRGTDRFKTKILSGFVEKN